MRSHLIVALLVVSSWVLAYDYSSVKAILESGASVIVDEDFSYSSIKDFCRIGRNRVKIFVANDFCYSSVKEFVSLGGTVVVGGQSSYSSIKEFVLVTTVFIFLKIPAPWIGYKGISCLVPVYLLILASCLRARKTKPWKR